MLTSLSLCLNGNTLGLHNKNIFIDMETCLGFYVKAYRKQNARDSMFFIRFVVGCRAFAVVAVEVVVVVVVGGLWLILCGRLPCAPHFTPPQNCVCVCMCFGLILAEYFGVAKSFGAHTHSNIRTRTAILGSVHTDTGGFVVGTIEWCGGCFTNTTGNPKTDKITHIWISD